MMSSSAEDSQLLEQLQEHQQQIQELQRSIALLRPAGVSGSTKKKKKKKARTKLMDAPEKIEDDDDLVEIFRDSEDYLHPVEMRGRATLKEIVFRGEDVAKACDFGLIQVSGRGKGYQESEHYVFYAVEGKRTAFITAKGLIKVCANKLGAKAFVGVDEKKHLYKYEES